MQKRTKWLLLAGMIWTVGGMNSAARAEESTWKKLDDVEAVEKREMGPEVVSGSACLDGNCAPRPACKDGEQTAKAKHPPFGSYVQPLSRWLSYRATPNQPCCKWRPTPYHPPLYTYFPCQPGQCAKCNTPVVAVTSQGEPSAQPTPAVQPVPMPIVPRYTQEEKPLIPGSSAALADHRDVPLPTLPPQ